MLLRPAANGPPPAGPAEAAWAVAGEHDVEVVSMWDADADRLVVGQPPVSKPIVLALAGDVTFEKVQADTDGMMPQMPPPGGGAADGRGPARGPLTCLGGKSAMRPRTIRPVLALAVAAAAMAAVSAGGPARDDEVRVTIVAVTASSRHQEVNPKLREFAREVQKREPSLSGYRLGQTESRALNVGQKESFKLVDDATADITVLANDEGRQRAPPGRAKPRSSARSPT